jgi:hypothetical protein
LAAQFTAIPSSTDSVAPPSALASVFVAAAPQAAAAPASKPAPEHETEPLVRTLGRREEDEEGAQVRAREQGHE